MTTDSLPISESVSWAWERFKENAALLITVHVVAWAVPAILQWARVSADFFDFVSVSVSFGNLVATATFQLGVARIVLNIHDGKPVEFIQLFDGFARVPWFALALIITGVAIMLGLVFLIVPGIIIAIRWWFIAFVSMDERVNAIDALEKSWGLTTGFTFDLFLLGLLFFGINFVGMLFLGVGMLVTLPLTSLATAYVYRHIQGRKAAAAQPAG